LPSNYLPISRPCRARPRPGLARGSRAPRHPCAAQRDGCMLEARGTAAIWGVFVNRRLAVLVWAALLLAGGGAGCQFLVGAERNPEVAVEGLVRAPDGQPAEGARVELFLQKPSPDQPCREPDVLPPAEEGISDVVRVHTDSRGIFAATVVLMRGLSGEYCLAGISTHTSGGITVDARAARLVRLRTATYFGRPRTTAWLEFHLQ
jgi:hypothetical protein